MVFIYRKGPFDISTGAFTSFSLMRERKEFLPAPFKTKCVSRWNETNLTINSGDLRFLPYDKSVCDASCRVESIFFLCGCIDKRYDIADVEEQIRNANFSTRVKNTTVMAEIKQDIF